MTDPIERADALDAQLHDSPSSPDAMIQGLVGGLNRQARSIKWIVVSIALNVLLSVALGIFAFLTVNTANRVTTNTNRALLNGNNAYISCLSDNELRANERALWDFVIKLPIPPGETTAQRATRLSNNAALTVFLDRTFAPRACKATK